LAWITDGLESILLFSTLYYMVLRSTGLVTRFIDFQANSPHTPVFEKLTFVVSPNHFGALDRVLPAWCGVLAAEKEGSGALELRVVKKSRTNPSTDPFRMAHLLWKNEALSLLKEQNVGELSARNNRRQLYEGIARNVSPSDLVAYGRDCFLARENWRDRGV
jgi:hypothetical protein